MPVQPRFVVLSGIPASGKTTVARIVSRELNLPLIDKDDILESLFDSRGAGDEGWRRTLSRESDAVLVQRALASEGAVLSSFWHQLGMPADSGTPTAWLSQLSGPVVHVHCCCDPLIAARRFLERVRHPGHLDRGKSPLRVTRDSGALAQLGALNLEPRVDIETSGDVDVARLILDIFSALASC
jgi:AAA domain